MGDKRKKLTKGSVEEATPVDGKTTIIWDTETRGFGLRVSSGGAKAYILQRRIGKKERRMTIGRVDDMTLDKARKEVAKLVAQIVDGIDPVQEQERQAVQSLTLQQAFENYIGAPVQKQGLSRGKARKPRTVRDIRLQMGRFKDWLALPIKDITEDMVKARHKKIADVSPAQANLAFRYLRACLNFAIADSDPRNPALTHNPVDRLNRTNTWANVEAAKGHVPADRLADFVQAVRTGLVGLRNEAEHRDAILFMLLTGARHAEVMGDTKSGYAPLKWSQVNLDAATVFFPEPKNRQPFTLHLSRQVVELLRQRQKISGKKAFVFGNGKGEVVEDLRGAYARLEKVMGFRVTSHDLRRSYTTAASKCCNAYVLKALVNHISGGDVTAGYVQIEENDIRQAAQAVADFILSPARILPTDNVVKLEARA
jgi:integrase